ncbi:L-threonine O-3-phosphate decarboxylase [Aliiroseovarius halocynthiae]|uniref:Aminotransferase n=1 Tax=Aliiroseovarius halocynthiae TaxID=985055 RepID=A0A545SN78_9RHOB|nr:threonine-phosphate decarboxylase [Aliiroseovarius halocynthiae]TQV66411.1 pyridoxal phosphate-dependent class II aminotransferase [Aliiroseovarius halocynthiae]SMR83391.1 L-threonine O-3-phosphate decarboxylase [Aliiroseovarius halocynthiae]
MTEVEERDHGGGLDAAIARFGGTRAGWLDLSTGINPLPYPVGKFSADAWTALPDKGAFARLEAAARRFWNVPDGAAVLAAPGASALIARIPSLLPAAQVQIEGPTYNEHAAGFQAQGWQVVEHSAPACVMVHPNNPDGRVWPGLDTDRDLTVIDESFCDVMPDQSLIKTATKPGVLILKSFGKFWGLAGLRLGFVIGDPVLVAKLRDTIGPWQVSGPALELGAQALQDHDWANETRTRLADDSARLDALMTANGAVALGGTTLFRLYDVGDAQAWQDRLAEHHLWSRIFPYSTRWLRLGLPHPDRWSQLETAL